MSIAPILILAADLVAASHADCPSDAEVRSELVRLGVDGTPGDTKPEITLLGDRMRVVLPGARGPVGSREVDAPASCHERAMVAAVLVATWMGIWPQGRELTPTVPAPVDGANIQIPAEAPPRKSSSAELALALQVAHDGRAGALGGSLLGARALTGRLRGFIAVAVLSEREAKVGPGSVGYLRPCLETGLALREKQRSWAGELGLSARWGLLLARGKGFASNQSASHFAPGLGAHVRINLGGRVLAPFGLVSGSYWLTGQTVTLEGDPGRTELPRWDVSIGLGISWFPGA
jgi:hypothetical protein